ncbi:MAG: YceI family protein [Bryobacterales bacterium]|nr:YceI family protein [Bryobacterales bacterium]
MRLIPILSLALFAVGAAFAAEYKIDTSHSSAQFAVAHLGISKTKGEFADVQGSVSYDPANLNITRIEAVIAVKTLDTKDEKRDAHLKSADFFDVEKFPTMTFVSKKVEKAGNNKLNVSGDLSIKGVTRRVVLAVEGPTGEVKDPWGGTRRAASATTRINRKDFGITWNKTLDAGGLLVGDEVEIALEIELIAQSAKISE